MTCGEIFAAADAGARRQGLEIPAKTCARAGPVSEDAGNRNGLSAKAGAFARTACQAFMAARAFGDSGTSAFLVALAGDDENRLVAQRDGKRQARPVRKPAGRCA